MVSLVPLHERILLLRTDKNNNLEFTKGGIIVPGVQNSKSYEAKVIALGSGRRSSSGDLIPFDVKIGDYVLLGKYSGVEVHLENKNYILVREEDILCILNK